MGKIQITKVGEFNRRSGYLYNRCPNIPNHAIALIQYVPEFAYAVMNYPHYIDENVLRDIIKNEYSKIVDPPKHYKECYRNIMGRRTQDEG